MNDSLSLLDPSISGHPLLCFQNVPLRFQHPSSRFEELWLQAAQPEHESDFLLEVGSIRDNHCWNSTQPAHKATNPRTATRWVHMIQALLNKPANPINAMDRMPAMIRFKAVPLINRGTSANSDSSRNPAMSTSARVKPRPAPNA